LGEPLRFGLTRTRGALVLARVGLSAPSPACAFGASRVVPLLSLSQKRPKNSYNYNKLKVSTTGKLGGCYFSLVLFSKSALRLILKIKAALFKT
jgi:hypothetical protein